MVNRPQAIVTGASSGIGYELALQFAGAGFDLVVAAEDQRIGAVAEDFRARGVNVVSVQTDLSAPEGVEGLYGVACEKGRCVDAIAINAGVGVGGDFARETSLQDELTLIDLNVRGSVHLAKLVLPHMVERNEGRLLFTSSIAATMPGPYEATYAASKAFLASFAHALRYELRDTGITVTVLMPGPTETEFFERAGMQDTKVYQMDKDDPADVAREGFEALMAGKEQVIAGSLKHRLQATAARVMPESAKAKMHGKLAQPGTANDE
jgi:short-subunit dehydrogenase